MAGLFGGFYDQLIGSGPPKPEASGAFGTPLQIQQLGSGYSGYLMRLLNQDVSKTKAFDFGDTALNEQIAKYTGQAKSSLGDAAISGGFADSGAVPSGLADIGRAGVSAYASGLRDLYLGLEQQRVSQINNILPFLSGAASESTALQQLLSQNMLSERGQNHQITQAIVQDIMQGYGMGSKIAAGGAAG